MDYTGGKVELFFLNLTKYFFASLLNGAMVL